MRSVSWLGSSPSKWLSGEFIVWPHQPQEASPSLFWQPEKKKWRRRRRDWDHVARKSRDVIPDWY